MNSKIKNIIIVIIISFFGISGVIDLAVTSHVTSSIIPSMWEMFMFFACLWSFVYSLDYLLDKKGRKKPFYNSVWLIFFYSALIGVLGIRNSDYFKADILIFANNNDDFGGIRILLRKDSTYEIIHSSIFDSESYQGKFISIGDTFVLDNQISFYGNSFPSNKLIVKQDKIYQLDINNNIPENSTEFYITN
ncbi:MAG: hypothetical protein IPP64_08510 [Bacteroidetes bacterium]|nr:hypothetical protein [Bacteroidota bacterium]